MPSYIPSLVKFLFKSFALFLTGIFLLGFESSLYILATSLLLNVWLANILSVCSCLSFCYQVNHRVKGFSSALAQSSICSVKDYAFDVISKNSLPNPKSWRCFSHMFFTLSFYILHLSQWSILCQFLYKVWAISCSFFCKWMHYYSSTICWKDFHHWADFAPL